MPEAYSFYTSSLTLTARDPQRWDHLFYHRPERLQDYLNPSSNDPLFLARKAHVLLNHREYQQALAILETLESSLAFGLKLICLTHLGRDVLGLPLPDAIEEDSEGLLYAHLARAIAQSHAGRPTLALEEYELAERYARALGLTNRLIMLALEKQVAYLELGLPDPDTIFSLKAKLPNPQTQLWGDELYLWANLYAGRYQHVKDAWREGQDDYLPDVATALLGQVASSKHELATNVRRSYKGHYEKVTRGDTADAYASIMFALAKFKLKRYYEAVNLLGDKPPAPPDLALYWCLLKIGLAVRVKEVKLEPSLLRDALSRLKQFRHVLNFARASLPFELCLASLAYPHPTLESAVLDVARLEHNIFQHDTFKRTVPWSLAQALHADAHENNSLGFDALHPMTRKRYLDLLRSRSLRPDQVVCQTALEHAYKILQQKQN
jgi:hypothetical protein